MIHRPDLLTAALAIALDTFPDIDVVAALPDLNDAVDDVGALRIDVAVVVMEDDGPTVAAGLCSKVAAPRVLLLEAYFSQANFLAGLSAGAIGYLTGTQDLPGVATAIRRAHAGELLYSVEDLYALLRQPPSARPPRPLQGGATRPSRRECDVLSAFATGASTDEVASLLNISVTTVRTHLRNVMEKLQARSKLEAVILALGANLIELPPARDRQESSW